MSSVCCIAELLCMVQIAEPPPWNTVETEVCSCNCRVSSTYACVKCERVRSMCSVQCAVHVVWCTQRVVYECGVACGVVEYVRSMSSVASDVWCVAYGV